MSLILTKARHYLFSIMRYTPSQVKPASKVYRAFHDEYAFYQQLIFALRKGELQVFTFETAEDNQPS